MKAGVAIYISAFFPSEAVPAAGNRLAFRKLLDLANENAEVHVITFQNQIEQDATTDGFPKNVTCTVFPITRTARMLALARFPFTPSGAAVRNLLARDFVRRLFGSTFIGQIFVDFTQSAALIPADQRNRGTLRVHDVLTQLYTRKAKSKNIHKRLFYMLECLKTASWETSIYQSYGEVVTLNEKDRELVAAIAPNSYVTLEFPTGYYVVSGRSIDTVSENEILFWGNYGRSENVEAVVYFAERVLPKIRAVIPEARLIAAGANPPNLCIEGVTWTGFVESPEDLFRSCTIGVVPLQSGAGIKIKTLEFVESGIPTVSTSIGSEGISPRHNLYVLDDDEAFSAKCVELMGMQSGASRV